MKKNIVYIFLIILSVMIIPNKVSATTGTVSIEAAHYDSVKYRPEGKPIAGDGGGKLVIRDGWIIQRESQKWITINGKKHIAFCLDPGSRLSSGAVYTCTPNNDAGIKSIMQSYMASGDYDLHQLAFRMYAALTGKGNGSLTNMRGAILRYNQIRTDNKEIMQDGCPTHDCPIVPTAYIQDMDGGNAKVDRAFSMTISGFNDEYGSKVTKGGSGLVYTKTNSTPTQITYKVTYPGEIKNVKFKCNDKCRIVGTPTWSGKEGTVTIAPADPKKCEVFEIQAFYEGVGVQLCTPSNSALAGTYQQLVISLDGNEEGGDPGDGLVIGTPEGEPTEVFKDVPDQCENPECCTKPIVETPPQINNCCEGGESIAEEPPLDELICVQESGMQLHHYWKKCSAEKYVDRQNSPNEFCELLCTEKVIVNTPSPISATSGRYFTLTKGSWGTSSPYIKGVKRCRMLVHYQNWHQTYIENINSQISEFNKFQYNEVYRKMFAKVVAEKESLTETITASCTKTENTGSKQYCKVYKKVVDPNGTDCVTVDGVKTCYKFECETNGTCTASLPTNLPTIEGNFGDKERHTASYSIYYFKNESRNVVAQYPHYYQLQLDSKSEQKHKKIDFELKPYRGDSNYEFPTNHVAISAYGNQDAINKLDSFIDAYDHTYTNKAECKSQYKDENGNIIDGKESTTEVESSIDVECKRGKFKSETLRATNENVEGKLGDYKTNSDNAKNKYGKLQEDLKKLKDKLEVCDTWFENEGQTSSNYDFSPTLNKATYSQVYLSEFGEMKIKPTPFLFGPGFELNENEDGSVEGSVCEISTAKKGDGTNGTLAEREKVSPNAPKNFGETSDELVYNLKFANVEGGLAWEDKSVGLIEKYRDEYKKETDKTFVHDAYYEAECKWELLSNEYHTLAPSGQASVGSQNYSANKLQYPLYTTTLKGTYQINWDIHGLGSRLPNGSGKFDAVFEEKGTTCAGEPASESTLLSCKIKVRKGITYIGTCSDNPVTINTSQCNRVSTEMPTYFKVVEPANIFPNGTGTAPDVFAKNWTDETKGKEVRKLIETDGKADATYSPSNISYTFKLDSKTIKAIKEYNAKQEKNGKGGYNDFQLICKSRPTPSECNTISGDQTCTRSESVVLCKSEFLRRNSIIPASNKNSMETASSGPNVHWITK